MEGKQKGQMQTMSKVDVNKQNKRNSLLTNAYDLFVNQGFNKTTISDIAKNSGLAKGTFYLYFKDKYDLRDELIARKSAQLLLEAQQAMKVRPVPIRGLEDYLLAMVDYVLNYLQRNKMLLKFISKNLSWGIFRHAVEKTAENPSSSNLGEFYDNYLMALKADNYECDDPELLLFTIIELVSSTSFSCIMYESPCTMEEYLPHLHQTIHLILEGYRLPKRESDTREPATEATAAAV